VPLNVVAHRRERDLDRLLRCADREGDPSHRSGLREGRLALLHWARGRRIRDTRAMRSRPHPGFRPAQRSAFAGFRFPPEVITLAVRWYLRFGLSYRDVEELLAERAIGHCCIGSGGVASARLRS
jgi:hypothetical protein